VSFLFYVSYPNSLFVPNLFCLFILGVQNLFCLFILGVQNLFCLALRSNFSLQSFFVPTLGGAFTPKKKVIINLNQSHRSKINFALQSGRSKINFALQLPQNNMHSNCRKINFALQLPQNKFCTPIAIKFYETFILAQ